MRAIGDIDKESIPETQRSVSRAGLRARKIVGKTSAWKAQVTGSVQQ